MALFPPDSALARLKEAADKKAAGTAPGSGPVPGSPRIPASPPLPGGLGREPLSPHTSPAGARIPAAPHPPIPAPGTTPAYARPAPPASPPGGTTAGTVRPPLPSPGLARAPSPSGGGLPGAAGLTRPGAPPPRGTAPRTTAASEGLLPGGAKPLIPLARAATGSKDIKITNEEFSQLRDFIYEQCGIHIAETRKYLIENRLGNRIRDLNLKTFGEYYYYLKFDANRRGELAKLFELITTNETSFYRNPPQLQVFQEAVLPAELAKLKARGERKLRIWSAGCSTGEEPYTMTMILSEVLKGELPAWDIKITANDLSEAVLASARRGVYSDYALRTTPQDIIDRYFIKDGSNFRVEPKLKQMISFGPVNLSDRGMLKRVDRSHIIFCRNVIIYFDDEMKRQVIESFYDNLLPGGCLFIGHSESLYSISQAFKPEHHTGTIVYRKQD